MAAKLNPVGNRVIAQQIDAQTKTASGIILPESAHEKAEIAEVLAVGELVKSVKKGDKVLYKTYSTPVKIEGEEYLVLNTDTDSKEGDILAIVG